MFSLLGEILQANYKVHQKQDEKEKLKQEKHWAKIDQERLAQTEQKKLKFAKELDASMRWISKQIKKGKINLSLEFFSYHESYQAFYEISGMTDGELEMKVTNSIYYTTWENFATSLENEGLSCSIKLVWDPEHRNTPGGLITQPKHTYVMKIFPKITN